MELSGTRYKKALKITGYFLCGILIIYFTFIFAFGGYGKKDITFHMPVSADNEGIFFAHRGVSLYYPENSLLSMQQAKDKGFLGVEIDIRKDKDGELIVFHDDFCDRLLGIKGRVDTMTSAEIKKYPLLFNELKFDTNVYMMTVKELLDAYGDDFYFYFDMKLTDFETADDMVEIIKAYHLDKRCIIANSDAPFVFYIENKYPEMTTALEGFDSGKEWTYYLMPKELKPDFFSSFYWNIDTAHVNWLKENDLLDYRISYGMIANDIKPTLGLGLKHLIVDYDSTMGTVTHRGPQNHGSVLVNTMH